MAFSKFKISKTNRRTHPVPIAAALPRSSSTQNSYHVEHESSEIELANDPLDPTRDQRFRCGKRRSLGIQNEATCRRYDCKCSQGHLAQPSNRQKGKHCRSIMHSTECTIFTSPQVVPQTASLSTSGDPQLPQAQYMTASSPLRDGRSNIHAIDLSSQAKGPMAFRTGLDDAGISCFRPTHSWEHKLDDIIDLFVGPRIAEQIFRQYVDKLAPACPIVVFPPGTSAGHVRKTKPLLFISILSVASAGICALDQQKKFAFEARNFLAENAIFKGEKSLELIQALLVVSFWYRAPENYARTNQNQLASVALSLALDLGLDQIERPKAPNRIEDVWDQAEAQRSWLGCFLLCASLSLIMRRPNPIAWTPRLDEYLGNLKQSKLSPSDDFLCKLLTTEHACYIANKEFSLSDPVSSTSLWEPKTLSTIEGLQTLVDRLSASQHIPLEKRLIEFGKFATSLYAYELAMHVNHNIDEFKAPFSAKSLTSCNFIEMQAPNTAYHSMICSIILAAQGLLDTFIGLSVTDMLTLPPHIYAGRVIYAVVLLMKLHEALSTSVDGLKENVPVSQLRLEAYIEKLCLISKRLNAEDGRSSLSRAFLIMPQLKEWLRDHISKSTCGANEETAEKRIRTTYCGASSLAAISDRTEILKNLPAGADKQGHIYPGRPEPLNGSGSQSIYPFIQDESAKTDMDTSSYELASDSWFWEFFNVDMLH